MLLLLLFLSFLLILAFLLLVVCLPIRATRSALHSPRPKSIAFFHPAALSGGGGERVLWTAIQHLSVSLPAVKCIVFIAQPSTSQSQTQRLDTINAQFNLRIPHDYVVFIPLVTSNLTLPKWYPRFTLVLQTVAALIPGYEALWKHTPTILIDTVGAPIIYPLARYIFQTKVLAYVHYPIISTDMLKAVRERRHGLNNHSFIANNALLSRAKLAYYHTFCKLYAFSGHATHFSFTNSSWTHNHILSLWKEPLKTRILYPPCDITSLTNLPIPNRQKLLISIAQFRPEKNHMLQLEVFKDFQKSPQGKDIQFVLIGGARDAGDEKIVARLRIFIEKHALKNVEVVVNAPYSSLRQYLSLATAGLHSMRDEHFGIAIVEFMAAGVIPIANNSAGPKMDIVVPSQESKEDSVGFLASTKDEYITALKSVFEMPEPDRCAMAARARKHSLVFSQNFGSDFIKGVHELMDDSVATH